MLLQDKNCHPRDRFVSFQDENHEYTVHSSKDYISVTTFVHTCFPVFNSDEVIDKMMTSSRWTSSKYFGKTKEAIQQEWEEKKNKSCEAGTMMHKSIEDFYNNIPCSSTMTSTKEYQLFMDFHSMIQKEGLQAYRTEWLVYDESVRIAGSIDMVYQNSSTKEFYIYDWKRVEELKEDNKYQKGLHLLNDIPDTNFWHYSLQLNFYKYILEKCYDIHISGMFLVCLHPNNDTFIRRKVPDLQTRVECLFLERRRLIEERIIISCKDGNMELPMRYVEHSALLKAFYDKGIVISKEDWFPLEKYEKQLLEYILQFYDLYNETPFHFHENITNIEMERLIPLSLKTFLDEISKESTVYSILDLSIYLDFSIFRHCLSYSVALLSKHI